MPAVWLSWAAPNLLCGRDLCHLAPNLASRASLLGTTCVADTCPPGIGSNCCNPRGPSDLAIGTEARMAGGQKGLYREGPGVLDVTKEPSK